MFIPNAFLEHRKSIGEGRLDMVQYFRLTLINHHKYNFFKINIALNHQDLIIEVIFAIYVKTKLHNLSQT
jgi:hypothetical protein